MIAIKEKRKKIENLWIAGKDGAKTIEVGLDPLTASPFGLSVVPGGHDGRIHMWNIVGGSVTVHLLRLKVRVK